MSAWKFQNHLEFRFNLFWVSLLSCKYEWNVTNRNTWINWTNRLLALEKIKQKVRCPPLLLFAETQYISFDPFPRNQISISSWMHASTCIMDKYIIFIDVEVVTFGPESIFGATAGTGGCIKFLNSLEQCKLLNYFIPKKVLPVKQLNTIDVQIYKQICL